MTVVHAVLLAARLLLAGVFALAGVTKLLDRAGSRLTERAACYRFLTGELAASVAAVQRLVSAPPDRDSDPRE